MDRRVAIFFLLLALLAHVVYLYATVAEYRPLTAADSQLEARLMTPQKGMPAAVFSNGEFQWGRYHGPLVRPLGALDFSIPARAFVGGVAQRTVQLKEWSWSAVTGGRWFCGTALSQVQYASGFFLYCVDLESGGSFHAETESIVGNLFGLGGTRLVPASGSGGGVGPNSGCLRWVSAAEDEGDFAGSHCFDERSGKYRVSVRGRDAVKKARVEIEYSIEGFSTEDAMLAVFPFGPKRAGTTVKLAGHAASDVKITIRPDGDWSAAATIQVSSDDKSGAARFTAILDWTRSMFPRNTTWNWVAFSTSVPTASGGAATRIGAQLTANGNAYRLSDGRTMESTLWINGTAHIILAPISIGPSGPPGLFAIAFPAAPGQDFSLEATFAMSSSNSKERSEHLQDFSKQRPLTDGELHHQWGVYTGVVKRNGAAPLAFRAGGVLELHNTVW